MPALNTVAELDRVRRLRSLLEPLAIAYDNTVLQGSEESFEVRLTARKFAGLAGENRPAVETIYLIDGESLQAVHDVWEEYRRLETKLLEKADTSNG